MAKKTYLPLSGMRAHYDSAAEQIVLTSTSQPLVRGGFRVAVPHNSRSELALKTLMRRESMVTPPEEPVHVEWNDENTLVIAGRVGIGKSSFAAILASALVQSKKKVLLVDSFGKIGGLDRFAQHPKNHDARCEIAQLELMTTEYGWDVLLAPEKDHEREALSSNPEKLRDYIARLSKNYDAVIFDSSGSLLEKAEQSPFVRYFSNILVLTHPYRHAHSTVENFIAQVPSSLAVNSLSSSENWETSPRHKQLKVFGSWPHMQDFYHLDPKALQTRGEPLMRMHMNVIPHLPPAFLP